MTRMMFVQTLGALLLTGTIAAAQARPQAPAAPARPSTPPAASAAAPATPTPAPLPFPADAKVAFVNMQYVLSKSKLGQAGFDQVSALSAKQQTEKSTQSAAIQKLQAEIQQGQSVLTPTVLTQKNNELERLVRQAQTDEQQRQSDLSALQQQLLEDFQDKVLPLVEQLRAEKNLWMVLTPGADGAGIVAANPALELSDELVKRLDALKPTPPAAAPAAK
jgi:Skp family chaperone for outer membrane proteins